ncbi:MAG: hypothetical protein ACKVQS_02250 [Fimbriimonadaceae bacterium]
MNTTLNATLYTALCTLSEILDQSEYKSRLLKNIDSRIEELEEEAIEYGEKALQPGQVEEIRQVYLDIALKMGNSRKIGVTRDADAKLSLQVLDNEVGKQLTLYIKPSNTWLELMWLDSEQKICGPSILFGDPVSILRNERYWQAISSQSFKLLDATGDLVGAVQLPSKMI